MQNKQSGNQPDITRRQWLKAVAVGAGAIVASRIAGKANIAANSSQQMATPSSFAKAHRNDASKQKVGNISKLQPVDCLECDSCMPCGYGVDIPGNFRIYNDLLASNSIPDIDRDADTSPEFAHKARKFLHSYDRHVPDAHQSQRCIKCFHCVSGCPQGIFIVNELASLTAIADRLRDWECAH